MTFPILVVLAIALFAVIGLSTDVLAAEVVAILIIVALVVTNVLGVDQALSGFGNSALMTIVGLMILTGGLIHNGAADRISRAILRFAGSRERRVLPMLLGSVAFLSAWINNTAATAMFVPVAEGISKRSKKSVSRYLMPVAFASMLGGCITLIGTSTNLAVSGYLVKHGFPEMGMFELAPVGGIIAVFGLIYLMVVPFPARAGTENRTDAYDIRKYLFELDVQAGSPYVGKSLDRVDFLRSYELTVLCIERGTTRILTPAADNTLEAGDLLLVEGDLRGMVSMKGVSGIGIRTKSPLTEKDITSDRVRLVEATISYNSPLIGWTLKGVGFRQRYGLNVLAVHRRGEALVEKVGRIRLKAGDVLLLQGSRDAFRRMAQEPPSLLLEDVVVPVVSPTAELISTIIFVSSVTLTATGVMPGAIAVLLGCSAMVLARTLTVQNAYQYLNLRLVILLAAMFALGEAMGTSGAAQLLASASIHLVGTESPRLLLAVLCVLTVVLTQYMNNAAAALLVIPIAVASAGMAGFAPRGLIMGITIAASVSFITPFEPACILIWDTGKYHFFDFLRMGLPLTIVAVMTIIVAVPWFWAF